MWIFREIAALPQRLNWGTPFSFRVKLTLLLMLVVVTVTVRGPLFHAARRAGRLTSGACRTSSKAASDSCSAPRKHGRRRCRAMPDTGQVSANPGGAWKNNRWTWKISIPSRRSNCATSWTMGAHRRSTSSSAPLRVTFFRFLTVDGKLLSPPGSKARSTALGTAARRRQYRGRETADRLRRRQDRQRGHAGQRSGHHLHPQFGRRKTGLTRAGFSLHRFHHQT